MQIGLAIDTLETIAMTIKDYDLPQRLGAYGAFGEIDRYLRGQGQGGSGHAKIREELSRYRWSIERLCGLSKGNGHDEQQHRVWMLAAADALRSDMCLGGLLDQPE